MWGAESGDKNLCQEYTFGWQDITKTSALFFVGPIHCARKDFVHLSVYSTEAQNW
jgi:hypothetical protein